MSNQASPEAPSDLRRSGVDLSRMQWQPIATAPKDGTTIWAYLFDSGIRQVKWLSAEAIAAEEGGSPDDWQEGFYEVAVEDDDNEWAPRWWLPLRALPEPPAQGMEARSAETLGSAREGDSPVREAEAPAGLLSRLTSSETALSDALARAERAERALEDLLGGIMVEGRNSDLDYPTEPGVEERLLEEPNAEEIAEYFHVKPAHTLLDLCNRIVVARSALSHPEPVKGESQT